MISTAPPYRAAIATFMGTIGDIWSQWISSLYNYLALIVDTGKPSIQVPVNAFSITMAQGVNVLTLNPAAALAAGTIVFPTVVTDGFRIVVSSTQTITTLTITPNTGQTVRNAPTTLAAGIGFAYYYSILNLTWFRLY